MRARLHPFFNFNASRCNQGDLGQVCREKGNYPGEKGLYSTIAHHQGQLHRTGEVSATEELLPFSARTGAGKEHLWSAILVLLKQHKRGGE